MADRSGSRDGASLLSPVGVKAAAPPRTSSRTGRWYLSPAFIVVVVLSISKAVWDSMTGPEVVDLWILSRAGTALFGSQWMDVFSDPGVQVGPLTLMIQGFLWRLAAASGLRLELLFALSVQPLVVLTCVWLVGKAIPDRGGLRRLAQAAVALLLVVWEVPWNAYIFGHPTEFFIPILWILAAQLARRGRGELAGAVVAASAGLKLWGLLGVALLFLVPRPRDLIRSVAIALLGVVLLYGPFFVFGDVATFQYRWIVHPGTGAAVVMPPGGPFGWLPRLVQGGFAVTVGAVVALWARRRSELFIWTPALAVIGARLATDPTAFPYYWLAAQAVLLVAAGWFLGSRAPLASLFLISVSALTFVASSLSVIGVSLLLIVIALTAALVGDRVDLTWVPLRRVSSAIDSGGRPLRPGP